MLPEKLKSLIANLVELGLRKRAPGRGLLKSQQTSSDGVTIVGLMHSDAEDGQLLAEIGSRGGWKLVFADTCPAAKAAVDQAKAPVVLCDRELLGMGWRSAVERLSGPPNHVCVILLSKAVDNYLWNDVVCAGGHDVLLKPLKEEGLIRALRLARTYWKSRARKGVTPGGNCCDFLRE